MSSRALLRVKRRRSEDPCEALVISCQPKRPRDSKTAQAAGGDYEGADFSGHAPPLPSISKVFHFAGTLTNPSDHATALKEIKKSVSGSHPRAQFKSASAKPDSWKKFQENQRKKHQENISEERYKAVLKKRDLDSKALAQTEDLDIFDVIKATEKHLDELDEEFDDGISGKEIITCNNVPMTREQIPTTGKTWEDWVYDLYTAEDNKENSLDLSFLDSYLDVQPYSSGELDALENYGIVEPASMLERGFLGIEDEDSNDEDNWRNDYPDSDPEDAFDREEPDYNECGFDAEDDDDEEPPLISAGDAHLAELLRERMKLAQNKGDVDEEKDVLDMGWLGLSGDPSKESSAYLEYKKRTMFELKMPRMLKEGGDNDDDDDDVAERLGFGEKEEEINYFAYDKKFDKDSESDSFEHYDDDLNDDLGDYGGDHDD